MELDGITVRHISNLATYGWLDEHIFSIKLRNRSPYQVENF